VAGEEQFVNPVAALRVLEVSLDGIREVIDEMDKRHDLRFADLQAQLERRFEHSHDLIEDLRGQFQGLLDVSERTAMVRLNGVGEAIQALRRELELALDAAKEAVTKAETANEKRFDSVNEFRASLSDLTSTLMPRSEAEIRFSTLSDAVSENTRYIDRSGGKATGVDAARDRFIGTATVIAVFIGAVGGIIVAVVLHG
jgi:hypothetical protein